MTAVGGIHFRVADEVATAPASGTAQDSVRPEDIRDGDVEVPVSLPVEEVEPGDPGTIMEPVQ